MGKRRGASLHELHGSNLQEYILLDLHDNFLSNAGFIAEKPIVPLPPNMGNRSREIYFTSHCNGSSLSEGSGHPSSFSLHIPSWFPRRMQGSQDREDRFPNLKRKLAMRSLISHEAMKPPALVTHTDSIETISQAIL
ncbi:hypothetical protein NE237_022768 [Protea cynaroides]|uniref:Uncharacterized protein n=1 Tax=Protea cynaroides TaxID=273540 RepID=A0A9Q0HFZ1_9MAGN|nr:hypothetical protein NE237_022768 [Protea cynaroides]